MPNVIIIKDVGVQGPPGPAGPSGGVTFPYTGSALITGSLIVTGSTISTQGFTGSLQGTSSYSNQSLSSSYALTASFALNGGDGGGGGNGGFVYATTDDQLNIFSETYLNGVTPTRIITGSINTPLTYTGQFQMFEIVNVSRQLSITLNTYGNINLTSSINITNTTDLTPGTYFSAPSGSYFSSITFNTTVGNQSIRVYDQIPQPLLLDDGLFTTSSVIISKNLYVYDDLEVFGAITGSLHGTSSYALTASFALNANTTGSGFPFSGSAVITGSIVAGNTPFSILNNTVRYNQTSSLSFATISLQPRSNLVENSYLDIFIGANLFDWFIYPSNGFDPPNIFVGNTFVISAATQQSEGFNIPNNLIGARVFNTGSTDIFGVPNFRYVGDVVSYTQVYDNPSESYIVRVICTSVTATVLQMYTNYDPYNLPPVENYVRFYPASGSGIINLQGYVTASKSLLVNGPTTISGSTNIKGLTNISGSTTITGSVTIQGQVSASSYIGSGIGLTGVLTNPFFDNLVVNGNITATGSLSSNGSNQLNIGTTNLVTKSINLGQIEIPGGDVFPTFGREDQNTITFNRNLDNSSTEIHTRINFNGRTWFYSNDYFYAVADINNHFLQFNSKPGPDASYAESTRYIDLQFRTKPLGSSAKGFSTDYSGTTYLNVTGSVSASAYYGNGINLTGVLTNPFTGSLLMTGSLSVIGPTSVNGPLSVTGSTSVNGSLSVTGSLTATGSVIITGSVNITEGINGVFIGEGLGNRTTNLVVGDPRALSTVSGGGNAGQNNIAIGSGSLVSATTAFRNIALGNNVLPLVTQTANNNIGIGHDVFVASSAGASLTNNIAIGNSASYSATSADNNIAIGTEAFFSNTSAGNNIAIGLRAGRTATGAASSIFIGTDAGANVTSGDNNIAIGFEALKLLTSVGNNIAIGFQAMVSGSGAQDSIAIGASALRNITTGDDNLAIGANALSSITTAAGNLAIGTDSMTATSPTLASNNTSIGFQSLQQITGSNNVALGYRAMQSFRSGSNNTIIGYNNISGSGVSGSNNTIIGANVVLPDGVHNNRIIIADGRGTQIITTSGSLTTISGSVTATSFSGSFTGSILATGSLTGSLTGSFTGSIFATGRVSQTVGTLSIVSSTASLDLSRGNFFTLTLAASSTTHINPINITAGQTTTVLITTTIGSDVTFPSSVKQQSGSAYVTSPGSAKDILTFISYDTSDIYVANVKNLI